MGRSDAYVEELQGGHEQARSNFQKALLIEPDNVFVTLDVGDTEDNLGNSEQALEYYREALQLSKTPNDSAGAYLRLRNFYETRGQLGKAIEYMHLAWAENDKLSAPLSRALMRLNSLAIYAKAGREELAFQTIESISGQLSPPWDRYPPLAYLRVYLELEDADNAQKAYEEFEPFIDVSAFESYRDWIIYAQGRVHEMRGGYEQALPSYENVLEREPHNPFAYFLIGRCYRYLQDHGKAVEHLKKGLKLAPFDPALHYEMALIHWNMDKKEKALEHLRIALDVWKEADPEFKRAQEAREKLAEWELVTRGK